MLHNIMWKLLSRNSAYAVPASVAAVPVTRTIRDIPTEVRVGSEDGLPKECVVNLDGIRAIPKRSLDQTLAARSPEKTASINETIKFTVGAI